MQLPEEGRKPDPSPTVGHDADSSRANGHGPTFTPEAESLLGHLRMGVSRSASAPPPADRPTIPGYEVLGELGSGGMGVVYKARHVKLNRTDAIKMIRAAARAAAGELTRFLAEAEAIASVKHPNVVQVYHLGEADGLPYFAMEFVAGGNLATLLKEKGRLAPTPAAGLLEAVARGVQAAHDASIVHRDLKPANILLAGVRSQESGVSKQESAVRSQESAKTPVLSSLIPDSCLLTPLTPKVSDFGLAKRLSSDLTRTQAVMGTPAYMAPEQAGGKAKFVGPAADVYALGVILYECLAGKVPFQSDDPWSLIRQVVEVRPEPVRGLVPDVPRDLELICLKCLEKEPHHRYPSAAALADDLRRFLNREPVSVRPTSTATRVTRWAKRHPATAALVALVSALALVVPPLAVWNQGRLDRHNAVAVEARKAEDEANRARDEAEKARLAALRLADARELFATQNALRNRAFDRPLGWTWANRADVSKAVALADEPQEFADLRSAAAVALLSHDLRPLDPILKGSTARAAATDPKSGLVALGEFKSWGLLATGRVRLVEPASGRVVRELEFPTEFVKGGGTGLVQDGVRSLAFSPDGSRLFVGTRGSKVVRFDLDRPGDKPAATWAASSAAVEQLAVSPDGKTVYGLCKSEVPVLAWDADTGRAKPKLQPAAPARVWSFAVLPSGDVVASNGRHIQRWTPDGKLAQSVENRSADLLAATPSRVLLAGDGATLAVHDRDSFEQTDRFTDPDLRHAAHDESLRSVAVHPSGAFVATASGERDRTVKVWGLASGRLIGAVSAPGTTPIALAWSADGRFLLATASGHVARWEFVPSAAERFSCVNGQTLASAALLPDGRVAAVSDPTGGRRTLLVGRVDDGSPVATNFDERGGNGRPGVAADPKGLIAVTQHRPGIAVGKTGSPVPPPGFTEKIAWCPRFGPDGRLWAIVDSSSVEAFDPATKESRGRWSNSGAEFVSGLASLDALAVGRGRVAVGARNGSVILLDATTCKFADAFPASGDPVLAVALAPDESLVAAGTQNGKLRLIRPADRTELAAAAAHPGGVTAVSISRDGTLLATGGRDRAVRLWKRSGDRFEPLLTVSDLPDPVRELQFSPTDGRLLVLLSHEHAARVWDIDQLKGQLGELKLGW